jgi:hypothetical protein
MATIKKARPTQAKTAPKKAVAQKAPLVNKPAPAKQATKKAVPAAKSVKETALKMPNAIFNIDEINELLKAVNHSNVNELKLEKGDFKITIRQGMPMVSSYICTTSVATVTAPSVPAHTGSCSCNSSTSSSTSSRCACNNHLQKHFFRSS